MHRFKTSGSIRGFGFVEFASKSAAERAVSALAPTEKDLVCSSNLDARICKSSMLDRTQKYSILLGNSYSRRLALVFSRLHGRRERRLFSFNASWHWGRIKE